MKISDDQGKSDNHHVVPLTAHVKLCQTFKCNIVTYHISENKQAESIIPPSKNAFSTLMQQSRLLNTVPKLKNVKTAKDSLYNEIVSLVDSHNVKFTNTNIETLGKSLCSHLTELLWHITSHHTYFEERALKFSVFFKQPWLCKDEYKSLHSKLIELIECTKTIQNHMESNNTHASETHTLTSPLRNTREHSQVLIINSVQNVDRQYKNIDTQLKENDTFKYIHLVEFEPVDRYTRRHWIENLRISVPIALFRMPYGGNIGTLNFVWKLPDTNDFDETL